MQFKITPCRNQL
jgi:hypothetical protein